MACRTSPRPLFALNLEVLESRDVPAVIGALDPSFGAGGKVTAAGDPFTGVALQSDGRIVAVGTSGNNFFVARYNPNGSLDTSFNGTGAQTIDFGGNDHANAVAIEPNGKIVIVGSTSASTNVAVARLTSTGALDTTFNSTGKLSIDLGGTGESGNALTIQSDGKIVIAGTTGADFAAIRLNPSDGSLDSTFNATGKQIVDLGGAADAANAIAIQSDGKILLAGTNGLDFALVRLNSANGSLDSSFDLDGKLTFDIGGVDIARGLAVQSDGKIVVIGSNGSDMGIARLTPVNGTLDSTFGTSGKQTVNINGADDARAVQLQADGKILVVGDTGPIAGGGDVAVVRLTTGGVLDPTFNATGKAVFDVTGAANLDLGTAAVLSPEGRLIVAGEGGGSLANGSVIRVVTQLEDPRNLAVGGSLNGRATIFSVDASTGQYNSSAAASVAAFGTTSVNVRAAIGDINGDGVEDTVLVTGPGTPIRVAVVSGKDNSTLLVSPFDPFGGNFTGGGFVSTADFDNDGRDEAIVTPDRGGGPRVTIFSLSASGAFDVRLNFLGINDPSFRGGARTGAGDVNGDGLADLAVAAGFEGGPRVAVYTGANLFSNPTKLTGDFFAFDPSLRNGVYVTIGDITGDGFGDLIFGAGPGGSPRILGISGQTLMASGSTAALAAPAANFFLGGNSASRGGARVTTTDVDGDGKADLVAGTGENEASFVRVYFGKNIQNAGEPAGFQALDPFSGTTFADGVFVG
jgi:uncharacterized delta-60 repeat protein